MIPAIDVLEGHVVRLSMGDFDQATTYGADPLAQARQFEACGARWVHLVDLDAARTGHNECADLVARIAQATSLNVEVGGGIRSLDVLARLADAGAARMVIGTALIDDADFAQAAVERYGDMLAAGIDAKGGVVAVRGWLEESGCAAADLARQVSDWGYQHLIFTDIARDGMQTGIDAAMYADMAGAFEHPVIASGGVSSEDDIIRLVAIDESVEAVIVGRAIYEGSLSLEEGIALCEKGMPC